MLLPQATYLVSRSLHSYDTLDDHHVCLDKACKLQARHLDSLLLLCFFGRAIVGNVDYKYIGIGG